MVMLVILVCVIAINDASYQVTHMMWSTLSEDRPMTDTMADGFASAAACMLSPLIFTSLSPSSNLKPASGRSSLASSHPHSVKARVGKAGKERKPGNVQRVLT